MRCNHCQSLMFEAEVVKEGHTEQTLFQCPTCNRNRLSSRPLEAFESGGRQRVGEGRTRHRAGGCPADNSIAVV